MTYKVALEALGSDAKIWNATSTALNSAGVSGSVQVLTDDDFSFIGSTTGLTTTYQDLKDKVVLLLQDGETQTTHIATTLLEVKKNYEDNERNAESRYKGQWNVK